MIHAVPLFPGARILTKGLIRCACVPRFVAERSSGIDAAEALESRHLTDAFKEAHDELLKPQEGPCLLA